MLVVKCHYCGKLCPPDAVMCDACGETLQGSPVIHPAWPVKNKLVAAVLAIFLGGIGAHKFYLGQPKKGIVRLILFTILLFVFFPLVIILHAVGIVEGIRYLTSSNKEFQLQNHVRLKKSIIPALLTGVVGFIVVTLALSVGTNLVEDGGAKNGGISSVKNAVNRAVAQTSAPAPVSPPPASSEAPYNDDETGYNAYGYDDTGDYLFPTDSTYIAYADLNGRSKEEVGLIRNEIYARYGYNFQTEDVRDFFMGKSWYYPVEGVNASTFGPENMNAYERKNLETIIAYEKEKGWRN